MQNVEKFKTWLGKHGAIVMPPTNEWEVIRFKTVNGVSVVYTNKRGDLTFTGESSKAHAAWKSGKPWKAIDRKRQQLRAQKARLATRDGKRCFAHGEKMEFDQLTIEHLLSFSHGGSDNENNLCLVCDPCNKELGNLPITKKIEKMMQLRNAYLRRITAINLDAETRHEIAKSTHLAKYGDRNKIEVPARSTAFCRTLRKLVRGDDV